MSTRYYLDSKWPDLIPQPSIKKVVEEVNEIDEDIEKQIRQLQEQKFQKGIQNVLPKEVDIGIPSLVTTPSGFLITKR